MRLPFTLFKQMAADQSGFSLIEAMVAMAIFLIGILGAYKLQLHATLGNALANRVSISTNWAAYAVEELLAHDYDSDALEDDQAPNGSAGLNAPLSGGTADGALYIQPDGSTDTAASGNDLYSIFWNIAEGDATAEPTILQDVKQIRVHVLRNGGIGNGLLYTHDYYKAKWPESDE